MNPNSKDRSGRIHLELKDEEKDHIRAIFHEEIAPKLAKLNARIGTVSCEFAGSEYRKWTIHFNSRGSSFEISNFEYDEDAEGIELEL